MQDTIAEETKKLTKWQRYSLRKKGLLAPYVPRRGYKQTAEHIAKRSRYGKENAAWKGDQIKVHSGRLRAIRMYPNLGPCVKCGNELVERHHIDRDTLNNEPENILIVCRRCHMEIDGRLKAWGEQAAKSQLLAVKAARVMWAKLAARYVAGEY